ncbi:uncharacterized protein B4U79_02759 [Dinothrombium tinctorium]|uniref:DNA-directed DNA polymerase n=1 Tax=Dinothrombium tinctorium TaxID=1965070 RepID=A0A3S3NNZ0_9ACAR|nr:uncharacterized protein B4U79_02759 [Dinothrombium tinctorium]
MYKFHYEIMKPKFSNIRLMYMDTDSFIYEISTDDIYEDMKVPGKFKDEMNGKIIEEFVGLRSKMYSFKVYQNPDKDGKKEKGIKKHPNLINSKKHDIYTETMN